jgi:5'-nucleotidase
LLGNDDGIEAPGLWHLARRLAEGHETVVVAPSVNQSGSSHSTTAASKALRVRRRVLHGQSVIEAHGTPADAVRWALSTLPGSFDVMVSGINAGENSGLSQYYSGTVAAAREAALRGIPAVSVSVWRDRAEYYEAAADFLATWLPRWFSGEGARPVSRPILLNVNFPDCPPGEIRGVRLAVPSMAFHEDRYDPLTGDPGDDREYRVVFGEKRARLIAEGTDDWALREGYVTVTPLALDAICAEGMAWLTNVHGPVGPVERSGQNGG